MAQSGAGLMLESSVVPWLTIEPGNLVNNRPLTLSALLMSRGGLKQKMIAGQAKCFRLLKLKLPIYFWWFMSVLKIDTDKCTSSIHFEHCNIDVTDEFTWLSVAT